MVILGNVMATAWQYHVNSMTIALQYHGNNMASMVIAHSVDWPMLLLVQVGRAMEPAADAARMEALAAPQASPDNVDSDPLTGKYIVQHKKSTGTVQMAASCAG